MLVVKMVYEVFKGSTHVRSIYIDAELTRYLSNKSRHQMRVRLLHYLGYYHTRG